jgi:hypothetical protein
VTSEKSYNSQLRLNALFNSLPQICSVPSSGWTSTGTVDAAITGMIANAAAVIYDVRVSLSYTGNQTAGVPVFRFHGPTPAWLSFWGKFTVGNSSTGTQPLTFTYQVASTTMVGPGLVNGQPVTLDIEGQYSCSAGGLISLQAFEGTSGDTFTVAPGGKMWCTPIGMYGSGSVF